MHGFLNANLRRLNTGIFWMSLLFVLPACGLDSQGAPIGSDGGSEGGGSEGGGSEGGGSEGGGVETNLQKGTAPFDDLVFCEIQRPTDSDDLQYLACAVVQEDIDNGIRLTDAAIALVEGRSSDYALDYSVAALTACGGWPRKIYFQGSFPRGFPVCLNCAGAIGTQSQPTVTAACQKQCLDFFGTIDADGNVIPDTSPDQALIDFCNANSKPATNTADDKCFLGACNNGAVSSAWVDPRDFAAHVIWIDLTSGVTAGGATGLDLTRMAATALTWDEGAVSKQWITHGDAFLEFSATAAGSVIVGLSQVPSGCSDPAACPDTVATDASIKFGILLRYDGAFFVSEAGVQPDGEGVDGSFGPSTAGDRFRVYVTDNGNGTASVRYAKLVGACMPLTKCNEVTFYPSTGVATYPLRVDSSLFHEGATITDARIVRIH